MDSKTMMAAYIVATVVLMSSQAGEAIIGMNWGRLSAQRLVPSQVVDLLLQNGIRFARIYSDDEDILKAFAGSGINLTVSVDFNHLTSMDAARTWVQTNTPYFDASSIRNVYLGGYAFSMGAFNNTYLQTAIKTMQYLQNALNEAGRGDIKVTIVDYVGMLNVNRTKPSESDFLHEIKPQVVAALRFLQANKSPLAIEMSPLSEIQIHKFNYTYGFNDNQSSFVVNDVNGAVYKNQFEFTYDSFVWALQKNNASDLKIIVAQAGWSTDGADMATATNAEHYFKYLLPYVASNKGTPMRPGAPIDTYVHALTDENKMPFSFTRHWGIYRSNGEPKFKIDLSGQGRDIYPVSIKGIMRMPNRWCVFNGDRSDMDKMKKEFDKACKQSDCTSIAEGGSCGNLTYEEKTSYAFNMYFQFQFQNERACNFNGLAYVSVSDPSVGECVFPVEVVKGQQLNWRPVGKGARRRPNSAIYWLLLIVSVLRALS